MQPGDLSTASGDASQDPLRLDRCPDCGYLLTGLPERGICPECGFAYRPDMIVLYGAQRNAKSRSWSPGFSGVMLREILQQVMTVACVLAVLALVMFPISRGYLFPRWILWIFVVFLAAAGFGLCVHRWWRQRREGLPGPCQLRLCPDGFAQRWFTGRVKLHPWTADVEVEMQIQRWAPLEVSWRRWPGEYYWLAIRICKPIGTIGQWSLADFGGGCRLVAAEEIARRVERWCQAGGGKFYQVPR